MKKINFIFCVHAHQPVGNFDHVLEETYEKSYRPFLDVVMKYPSIKIVLHFSGSLLIWLSENKKDYIAKVKELVRQGRAEIISSGMFEPVLAVLPDVDKLGQITQYNRLIKEVTGYEPTGAWLTERIYEPHLPKRLHEAGIGHIVIDDYHFIKSGLNYDELYGYYITEEEGYDLKVFPGSERLRYLIPFKDVGETLEYFKMIAGSRAGNLAVLADDTEKFGSWPNTYDWVYGQRWLERFLEMLTEHQDLVRTTTFSEYIKQNKALGRVYLPSCSYMEMGKWTLPPEAARDYEDAGKFLKESGKHRYNRFITGGTWRNFIAKYPESNNMHKKMLYVSKRIHEYYKTPPLSAVEAPDYLLELYKGQCNDAYWHGVFGGLYLPHLRDAIYRHLINAEILLDKAQRRETPYLDVKCFDINVDGHDEIIVESDLYNIYLQPADGGAIYEFDYKPALFNIMNTLTRRREEYHNKILPASDTGADGEARTIHDIALSKEEGLEKLLSFDKYNKVSCIDHFLDDVRLEDLKNCTFTERGDFAGKEYDYEIKRGAKHTKVILQRYSHVMQGESKVGVMVKKSITMTKGSPEIDIEYRIRKTSPLPLSAVFGVEFNLSLLSPNDPNRFYDVPCHVLNDSALASEGELYDIGEIRIVDRYLSFDVCFDFPKRCNFIRFPVQTVSISEGGFERIFQASSMLFFKTLNLINDDEFVFKIKYAVKKH